MYNWCCCGYQYPIISRIDNPLDPISPIYGFWVFRYIQHRQVYLYMGYNNCTLIQTQDPESYFLTIIIWLLLFSSDSNFHFYEFEFPQIKYQVMFMCSFTDLRIDCSQK